MSAAYPIELFDLPGFLGPVARGVVLTSIAVIWTLVFVRLLGLRALSKMTAFDFVSTVATASLIAQAGTRADWFEFAQAMTAIGAVFMLQWGIAKLRLSSEHVARLMRNEPLLLMKDGAFLEAAMSSSRVSRSNLLEKIRAANVHDIAQVRAAVLETTGDISIITGGEPGGDLLKSVRTVDDPA